MSSEGVKQEGLFVGDLPFGLTEKDAKFARWDARKTVRWGNEAWRVRRSNLFESTTNNDLLDKMSNIYSVVVQMETHGLAKPQIFRTLLEENPNLSDYNSLLCRTPWGIRLRNALQLERYEQDENKELWSDFVMGRIHRALGGKFKRLSRFDGRSSFKIQTGLDIIYFSPESSACLNDGPVIHLRGNKIAQRRPNNFDTNQRFDLTLDNISRVEISEMEEKAEFVKALPGLELKLSYRQKPVGSVSQIELRSIPIKSKEQLEEEIRNYVRAVRSGFKNTTIEVEG